MYGNIDIYGCGIFDEKIAKISAQNPQTSSVLYSSVLFRHTVTVSEHQHTYCTTKPTELKVCLALIRQYTNRSIVYIYHVLCLICYIEAKALANYTMPGGTKFLIHGCFY
jgi:hypothetical protein